MEGEITIEALDKIDAKKLVQESAFDEESANDNATESKYKKKNDSDHGVELIIAVFKQKIMLLFIR